MPGCSVLHTTVSVPGGDTCAAEETDERVRFCTDTRLPSHEIAVVPIGAGGDAKTANADLDKGIEQNLDAALIQNKMNNTVKYAVKSGVVTLTGEVNAQGLREAVQRVAAAVPNVKQVVNDVQGKNQKARSTK